MLKHYLKLELRNLNANKLISAFKLMGLTLGFIVSFVIAQYTINELSYDSKQPDIANKYILKEKNLFFGAYTDHTPFPLGTFLKENCPDISQTTSIKRLADHGYIKTSEEYINLNVDQFVFAEKNLFSFIHFNFIEGNPENCFNRTAPAIISKRIADKHFAGLDAIGKNVTVRIDGQFYEFTITAIVESLQPNTNFEFEWISSIEYLNRINKKTDFKSDWQYDCENYFQLKEGTNIEKSLENITAYYQQNASSNKEDIDLKFEKVSNIHLYEAQKKKLVVFNTLAFLILIVSIINYVLLSTADNFRFLKNRGIELISGAKKRDILLQYIISTFVNVFIALFLAIAIIIGLHPLIQQYFPYHLDISSNAIELILLVIGASIITISIAAGLRRIVSNSQSPIHLLKNKFRSGKLGARISNALLVFQLISFIGLVAVSVVMKKQLNFMLNSDLGFNQNYLISLKIDKDDRSSFNAFKQELLSNSAITSVTGTDCPPLVNHRAIYGIVDKDSLGNQILKQTEYIYADKDYLTTMEMSLEQGQDLSLMKKGFCIVNKTFLKDRGIKEPIGTQTDLGGRMYTIAGVLEDFNQHDFREKVSPFVLYLNSSRITYALIRILPKRIDENILFIRKTAQKQFPNTPFEYHFMDKVLENKFKAERTASNLVMALTFIVITISLMGLLGLSLLMTQNKIKEIGIRKVNGAKIGEIMVLLNKDFVKWVIAAFIIATPIAYYAMNKWLENFAYKTELSWWIFAIAGVVALGIALLTVSWQSWKAATGNPVEALRYE